MSKPVKVYNKGTRPIVFKRDLTGTDAIHPRKFSLFIPEVAEFVLEKFEDACSEEDYKKILEAESKKKEEARKKSEAEAKKKAKAKKEEVE